VLLPAVTAAEQSFGMPKNNPTGLPNAGDFALTISDPPSCTVGFLPPSQWRNPADTTTIDTPDGLYCKLPQDSPLAVRGARNYPCMGHPGKRAPTVQLCDDPKGFQPLATRSARTPSTRIWSHRVSPSMIASTSTIGSSRR
jgi:phospholipid/cholesterol/gamma-HCH transport system substrate-binding protein